MTPKKNKPKKQPKPLSLKELKSINDKFEYLESHIFDLEQKVTALTSRVNGLEK